MQNAAATITEGKNDDFVSIEIANFWRSNYFFLTTEHRPSGVVVLNDA